MNYFNFNNIGNIPKELIDYNQWVVWGEAKAPYNPSNGNLADVNKRLTWSDFNTALNVCKNQKFNGIGFVLTEQDPFAVIDLDYPEGNLEIVNHQNRIFETFNSYAEISPSGQGLHILIKGSLPVGRKRNKIELYSSKRYITVTGNTYRHGPINSCQFELTKLFNELGGSKKETQVLDDSIEPTRDDEEVYNIAAKASNGQKFEDLWEGHWELHYDSQSEADLALVNIIAYYTDSKSQIIRMFHNSALGKRKKAKRKDYLDYMLNICFDNVLPTIDLSYLLKPTHQAMAKINMEIENEKQEDDSVYDFPPGLVGKLASFFMKRSNRPVKEMSLMAAIALMAGITGRAYNCRGAGLNLYCLLLAETGTGKGDMRKRINDILNRVVIRLPSARQFKGPMQIASPQALIRYLDEESNSFLSLLGEFGHLLKAMSSHNASEHLLGLKRFLLELFSSSGKGDFLDPMIYASKDKNTKPIDAPAFSFLGETTPEIFYSCLSEQMIAEGLLPRFLTIEYKGLRPYENEGHSLNEPSSELIDEVATLCSNCEVLNRQNEIINVELNEDALKLRKECEIAYTDEINRSNAGIRRQLWNRANLKTQKLAAIVAVGINPYKPVVDANCWVWAQKIVQKDCENIIARFMKGDFGTGVDENEQRKKIVECIKEFLTTPYKKLGATYRRIKDLQLYHHEKVVPYSFIYRKVNRISVFKNHPLGSSEAIKRILRSLVDTEDIVELSNKDKKEKFNSKSACYVVCNAGILENEN